MGMSVGRLDFCVRGREGGQWNFIFVNGYCIVHTWTVQMKVQFAKDRCFGMNFF